MLAEDDKLSKESSPAFLEALVALEEAVAFLEQRSRVLPAPPSPLPKDRRLRPMPLHLLVRAAEPFARRAELHLKPETFGLHEAWERIKGFLWGLFGQLPLRGWNEQTVAFAALLEAKKQGEVELWQQENFGALEVELKASR